ncbi:BolA family protein [Pelistega suis]|uniref:BolA family transcriptional regulator n=1 Tax=Pelistega suis TaxID=1631957 RepID=A0A849P240_9BURK|nr:BolA family protein [Pelistega suis]NOL51759.1 BolA family transcriptional regulator [Pelistega suis]
MNQDRTQLIKERLQVLEPIHLEIIDESHFHQGHSGNQSGASHFRVMITSKKFEGLTLLAQQRLVYSAVADLLPYPIHALAVNTRVPTSI